MLKPAKKIISAATDNRLRREAEIVSKLWVNSLLLLRPQSYGTRHIGAALEKVAIVTAVNVCEGDRAPCTAARLARLLRMPRTNVQRALAELMANKVVHRIGQVYFVAFDTYSSRLDPAKHKALCKMVIEAGRQLEKLGTGNGTSGQETLLR